MRSPASTLRACAASAFACLVLVAPARAGITFSGSPTVTTNPTIIGGTGVLTTLPSTITPIANGFQLNNFGWSYTPSAGDVGKDITLVYVAQYNFGYTVGPGNAPAQYTTKLHSVGSMSVPLGVSIAVGNNSAGVSWGPGVSFTFGSLAATANPIVQNGRVYPFDVTALQTFYTSGPAASTVLQLGGRVIFHVTSSGQAITLSNSLVTAETFASPEPGTIGLSVVGVAAGLFRVVRRRKS